MNIYVFGNADFLFDSLPFRLLPALRKRFPHTTFEVKDSNEEWDIPDTLIMIDAVKGLGHVAEFSDLKNFSESPRISLHDFDIGSYLKYLKKLGKLKKIKIIGIPPMISEKKALEEVSVKIRSILREESASRNSCKDHTPE